MKIVYKDKEDFKNIILKSGFNPSSLSLKIGKSRQYIYQTLKKGIIGASGANKVCELLKVEFNDLFEIV